MIRTNDSKRACELACARWTRTMVVLRILQTWLRSSTSYTYCLNEFSHKLQCAHKLLKWNKRYRFASCLVTWHVSLICRHCSAHAYPCWVLPIISNEVCIPLFRPPAPVHMIYMISTYQPKPLYTSLDRPPYQPHCNFTPSPLDEAYADFPSIQYDDDRF